MFRNPTVIKLTYTEITYLINNKKYNTLILLKTGEVYCTRRQQTVLIRRYKPRTKENV